ncbi:MAG: hypothetical protein ACRBCI_15680 [Cellvibrionaceae bacterium]
MLYPAQLLFLTAAFLVPNSQAVKSNNLDADMNAAGYYCSIGQTARAININYGESEQGLPCQVTLQEKVGQITQLLEAKRNVAICETKAKIMATRLIDRGWHCQSSGI